MLGRKTISRDPQGTPTMISHVETLGGHVNYVLISSAMRRLYGSYTIVTNKHQDVPPFEQAPLSLSCCGRVSLKSQLLW